MAPAALAYTYCTQADIEHLVSAQALKLRLDNNGDGILDSDEQATLTDAITEASETINFYLWSKYDPAILNTSNWITRKATILAAYRIASNRMNPVPEQLIEDALKVEEELKAVADGPRMIPGIGMRRSLAPVWSNTRIDVRYSFRCIRVEKNTSSRHNQTPLPQNVDYQDQWTPDAIR